MSKIGLYIHIPFCNQICPYCDFYSAVQKDEVKEAYTKALLAGITNHNYGDVSADTLYFGGGTPSVLGGQRLVAIAKAAIEHFQIAPEAEICLEMNPESTTLDLLVELRKGGFNRVSFGVQTANEKELKALGRLHTIQQAKEAILFAKEAGFPHISADLMMGIPYQTEESLKASVDFLTALPLDHISAYMLTIEEGTPFHRQKMEQHCPTEEEVGDLYLQSIQWLDEAGFAQYEISNFAKKGGESLHNLKYWNTEPYIGIGPSAHSYFNGKRFYVPSDITEFIAGKGDQSGRVADGTGGDYAEYGMLKLRLKPGLHLPTYKEKYPEIDEKKIMDRAKILEKDGCATIADETITFTPEGFLLSNYYIAQLLF